MREKLFNVYLQIFFFHTTTFRLDLQKYLSEMLEKDVTPTKEDNKSSFSPEEMYIIY